MVGIQNVASIQWTTNDRAVCVCQLKRNSFASSRWQWWTRQEWPVTDSAGNDAEIPGSAHLSLVITICRDAQSGPCVGARGERIYLICSTTGSETLLGMGRNHQKIFSKDMVWCIGGLRVSSLVQLGHWPQLNWLSVSSLSLPLLT